MFNKPIMLGIDSNVKIKSVLVELKNNPNGLTQIELLKKLGISIKCVRDQLNLLIDCELINTDVRRDEKTNRNFTIYIYMRSNLKNNDCSKREEYKGERRPLRYTPRDFNYISVGPSPI